MKNEKTTITVSSNLAVRFRQLIYTLRAEGMAAKTDDVFAEMLDAIALRLNAQPKGLFVEPAQPKIDPQA